MGCFSNCFGNKNRHQRRRRRPVKKSNNAASLLHHLETCESVEGLEVPKLIEEKQEQEEIEKGEIENQAEITPFDLNDAKRKKVFLSERKKVTFDLNVRVYEDLRTEFEEEEEKNGEFEENNEAEIKEEKHEKSISIGTQCNSDSSSSSLFSFPTNHRYKTFRDSDDEFDELLSSDESEVDDYCSSDDEEEEVESEIKSDNYNKQQVKVEEQSSESLFSLSLDSKKHELGGGGGAETEVNSLMLVKNESNSDSDRMIFVDSILNPVENLSQWKIIKAKSKLVSKNHHQEEAKENIVVSGENFSFFPVEKKQVLEKEIGVDTSLSTWLDDSQKKINDNDSRSSSISVGNSPNDSKKCSPKKFEDRPILGALTLEEIRQHSASCSPRKSPSKSPEDVPIIGSVGSYWKHTDQTADTGSSTRSTKSKYRESAEVIWDSTPFETRLEKALEKESKGEQVLAMRRSYGMKMEVLLYSFIFFILLLFQTFIHWFVQLMWS